jgi:hypothetical protein
MNAIKFELINSSSKKIVLRCSWPSLGVVILKQKDLSFHIDLKYYLCLQQKRHRNGDHGL